MDCKLIATFMFARIHFAIYTCMTEVEIGSIQKFLSFSVEHLQWLCGILSGDADCFQTIAIPFSIYKAKLFLKSLFGTCLCSNC